MGCHHGIYRSGFFGHVIHLVLALASCDADVIVNGTTAFVNSRQLKWGAT